MVSTRIACVTLALGSTPALDVSKEVSIGSDRSLSWSGKMRCELMPTKTGPAIVRARLSFPSRPPSLAVRDISLVLKE